jgi:formylglycine-generating enzyme required for sulfatase activity
MSTMMNRTLLAVLAALAVAPSAHAAEGAPPILPPKADLSTKQVKSFKPGVYEVPESHGLLLTRVSPGAFKMGSPQKEIGREADETQRKIRITKPFYIGITEVTQAQYLNAMFPNHMEYCQNKGPWGHTLPTIFLGGPWGVDRSAGLNAGLESDHPMDMLTWTEATQYAAWLNKREAAAGRLPKGYVFRLPTEAEWEYACRAGTKGPFGTPGELEEFFAISPYEFDGNVLAPYGRRKPNAWGLYDMHGSLYEWVQDWHGPYDKTQTIDPTGLPAGKEKVVRGGSYISYKEKDDGVDTTPAQRMRTIRSASRNHFPSDYSLPITGMRVVLGPVLTSVKETK